MSVLKKILTFVSVFAVIFILLISSVELAAYGSFSYYQKEYEKYDVKTDLDMEMDDIMYVTKEMMAYLRGDREELSVTTKIEGEVQDFFNEQDRVHMYDVQQLFIGGLRLRLAALAVLVVCIVLLIRSRQRWVAALCKAYWIGLGVFLAALGGLAYLFSRDFTKYFTVFHEIFFTNDLWIFDPANDYMIRMLPEGFFYDMAARIAVMFGGGLIALFIVSVIVYRLIIRRNNEKV